MPETASRPRWLPCWLAGGLAARLLAALVVQWAAARRGTRCLFPDTEIYWQLGQALRRGAAFVVSQWGVPHFALRTPGYPLFLAFCQMLFGDHTLPARLAQAVLGAACIGIVYRFVARVMKGTPRGASAALVAAALTAFDPGTVGLSALLLSEAVFVPLMLLGLWGLAALWQDEPPRRSGGIALGTGAAWARRFWSSPPGSCSRRWRCWPG